MQVQVQVHLTLTMWVQTGQTYKKDTSCEAQALCILIWDVQGTWSTPCHVCTYTHTCVCQNAGLCLEIANHDQQTLLKAPQLETHTRSNTQRVVSVIFISRVLGS